MDFLDTWTATETIAAFDVLSHRADMYRVVQAYRVIGAPVFLRLSVEWKYIPVLDIANINYLFTF